MPNLDTVGFAGLIYISRTAALAKLGKESGEMRGEDA